MIVLIVLNYLVGVIYAFRVYVIRIFISSLNISIDNVIYIGFRMIPFLNMNRILNGVNICSRGYL